MDAETEKEEGQVLVSICCLTYNHETYIRDALDGFLMQKVTFPYEILIYDDASTDGTADIIREYQARYPDIIKPLLQTENQYSRGILNPSGAFNFPRVRGKYTAMCEGDDYWIDEHKLQMQVDYLESHPGCSLCFHSARIRTVDGSRTDRRMRPYRNDGIITPQGIIDKSCGYPTASMVFRSEMIRNLPDYYKNCPVGDTPLQLMAAARGYGYYVDRDMSVYRVGAASSWTKEGRRGDYEARQQKYCKEMRRTYLDFDRAEKGRFKEAVKSAARRTWFLTKVNTRHYEVVLSPRYRRYYKELTKRTRFYIRLEAGLPGVYRLLAKAAGTVRRQSV
ncbi:MAG: glycosyltransferase [Hungatella sp.]|nr:glycosyltransferase [Hungatella sp.]